MITRLPKSLLCSQHATRWERYGKVVDWCVRKAAEMLPMAPAITTTEAMRQLPTQRESHRKLVQRIKEKLGANTTPQEPPPSIIVNYSPGDNPASEAIDHDTTISICI